MRHGWFWTALLVGAVGCGQNKAPPDIGPYVDADADADADAYADADADADADDATSGLTFCAGGGEVSSAEYSGVFCTSPLEIAPHPAGNDSFTWQPGPAVFIAP